MRKWGCVSNWKHEVFFDAAAGKAGERAAVVQTEALRTKTSVGIR